jgi:hypothetical protein
MQPYFDARRPQKKNLNGKNKMEDNLQRKRQPQTIK